jgi:hypothetical protein
MKKWQQLKVEVNSETGQIWIPLASNGVVEEFILCAGEGNKLLFEHIDWLGWGLVTVCKSYMYYKRQTTE